MTMLDDEALSALLHELGDSYAVPASGLADTLIRVRRGDDEQAEVGRGQDGQAEVDQADPDPGSGERPAPRTVGRMIRTHRLLAVAAALVLLLALAGGAAILGSSSPANRAALASRPRNSALTPAPTRHPSNLPLNTTTTVPQRSAAPGTTFSAAAPSAQGLATSSGATSKGAAATGTTSKGAAATGTTSKGAAATGTSSLPLGTVGQPARIEQTGSLDLAVARGRLTSTMNKLTSLASTYGGYVANSQTQSNGASGTSDGPPSGTVTLQVPVASFSAVLAEAKSLGKPTSVTTKATDVTGQYVDLQAQINALELSRQQYLTIMAKATTVGDVLAVQAQLDSLQSQIQQLQGQLAVIGSETDYSTLIVAVSEPGTPHHAPAPAASGVDKAWHDSLHGFAVGVDGIIRLAGPFLFALLCLAVLVVGGRLTWRRVQRHNL